MTCNLNHCKMITPFLSSNWITIPLRNIRIWVESTRDNNSTRDMSCRRTSCRTTKGLKWWSTFRTCRNLRRWALETTGVSDRISNSGLLATCKMRRKKIKQSRHIKKKNKNENKIQALKKLKPIKKYLYLYRITITCCRGSKTVQLVVSNIIWSR